MDEESGEVTKTESGKLRYFVCPYNGCNKVLGKALRLERHLRRHLREVPYVCPEDGCEKGYTCKEHLDRHVRKNHSPLVRKSRERKTYQCTFCPKVYKQKCLLRTHLATHTGDKPFKCDQCEASYALKSRLKRHQKTHAGYKCKTENCDFVGTTWGELRKHTAGCRKPECRVCGEKFPDAATFNEHKQTHKKPVQEFKCPHEGCTKSFAKNSNLTHHIKVTHEHMRYICEFEGCEKVFKHNNTLVKHMKVHDKDYKPPVRAVTLKRKTLAEELSGLVAEAEVRSSILKQDKKFRTEQMKDTSSSPTIAVNG